MAAVALRAPWRGCAVSSERRPVGCVGASEAVLTNALCPRLRQVVFRLRVSRLPSQRQLPGWRSCRAISESKNAAGRHQVGSAWAPGRRAILAPARTARRPRQRNRAARPVRPVLATGSRSRPRVATRLRRARAGSRRSGHRRARLPRACPRTACGTRPGRSPARGVFVALTPGVLVGAGGRTNASSSICRSTGMAPCRCLTAAICESIFTRQVSPCRMTSGPVGSRAGQSGMGRRPVPRNPGCAAVSLESCRSRSPDARGRSAWRA